MFEKLALHSSVLFISHLFLEQLHVHGFFSLPQLWAGRDSSTQIPCHWLSSWVCVGSWQEGLGTSWSRDNPGGEEGAGCFACCLASVMWLYGRRVSLRWNRLRTEIDWQEPVKPVACEALRLWRCSWSPHSHHFLLQPMWSAAVCSSVLSQVLLFSLIWTSLLFSFTLSLSLFPYFTFIWFDLPIMPFLTSSLLFYFPNHFLAKPLPSCREGTYTDHSIFTDHHIPSASELY